MKEIRFRVRNTKTNKWIHGPNYEVNLFGETILLGCFMEGVGVMELNDCVVLQYTGLHYENGKEIYEGDIINTIANRYVIEYDNERAKFIGRGLLYDKDILSADVIVPGGICLGNIYDNPELLT